MNLQHLRYMAEVERVGSITKAAANLFMGQPNLSKAIKEVENEIGITVFRRSAKGVFPTPKGAEFLAQAKEIIMRMEKLEALYKPEGAETVRFSAAVPDGAYIIEAFGEFAALLEGINRADVKLIAADAADAIAYLSSGSCNIAVIRCDPSNEYCLSLLSDKGIKKEKLITFEQRLLVSSKSPLAEKETVSSQELYGYTEIICQGQQDDGVSKRLITLRGESPYELLEKLPCAFMRVSPTPVKILERFGLSQVKLEAPSEFTDYIIYPASCPLTGYEADFRKYLIKAITQE